jgi:hypothetical protein
MSADGKKVEQYGCETFQNKPAKLKAKKTWQLQWKANKIFLH